MSTTSCSSTRFASTPSSGTGSLTGRYVLAFVSRRDGQVQAGVELEPQEHALDLIEAVARHDAQVVARVVGDAGRKRDLQVPRRALGWPLTIPMLQLAVGANRHGLRRCMTG